MRIRSITCFYNPGAPESGAQLDRHTALVHKLTPLFEAAGYPVQTCRLVTVPFPQLLPCLTEACAVDLTCGLEEQASKHGFSYLALGPALPDQPEAYRLIPAMLRASQTVFVSASIANARSGVDMAAVHACARIISEIAPYTREGFTNLNFCASACVPPEAPFFPAAYHEGMAPAFALAVECADAAVEAFTGATSLADARLRLLNRLESAAAQLSAVIEKTASAHGIRFQGFDFPLAPFPEDWCSIGGAMECLGLPQVGMMGSLAAAAFLADTLDQGRWLRTGFNGLMMPVLEDSRLARATVDGTLTLRDLLMYSAVCGTGLDTVPLPGDASPEQLSAVLLDVAALAVRLGKPLTARLMPVPGKKAGDLTHFDFAFFANGRILELPAAPLTGLLASEESFMLRPRR